MKELDYVFNDRLVSCDEKGMATRQRLSIGSYYSYKQVRPHSPSPTVSTVNLDDCLADDQLCKIKDCGEGRISYNFI